MVKSGLGKKLKTKINRTKKKQSESKNHKKAIRQQQTQSSICLSFSLYSQRTIYGLFVTKVTPMPFFISIFVISRFVCKYDK